jgi:teichuronic acid biosynthesis glycosyltransferase TuaC
VAAFVGAQIREKGVREFAAAILDLPEPVMAVLVGAGPEQGHLADDPRARGRLRYLGARPHEDVARVMAAADVLVLPSYGEGLPTVLVEAGSLGLPVVASRVGGIPSLLAEGRGALLAEVSSAAVAAAVADVIARPEMATAAAGRLREHVEADYDVDRNAARLAAHYAAILRPDPGAR